MCVTFNRTLRFSIDQNFSGLLDNFSVEYVEWTVPTSFQLNEYVYIFQLSWSFSLFYNTLFYIGCVINSETEIGFRLLGQSCAKTRVEMKLFIVTNKALGYVTLEKECVRNVFLLCILVR